MADIRRGAEQKDKGPGSPKNFLSETSHFLCIAPRCIGSYLVRGLIIVVPLAITLWVLVWFFNLIDGLLAPILEWGLGRPVPGLGFAIIVTLVILIGFLGMKIGHQRFFDRIETRIMRIPVVGAIYGGTREFLNSFNTVNTGRFMEVVIVEYPRRGIYTVGFVTSEAKDKEGKRVLNVFIPTAPTPAGGFLQIVPESEIVHTSMSISDAMKLIVSIGRVSREDIADMLTQFSELRKGEVVRN